MKHAYAGTGYSVNIEQVPEAPALRPVVDNVIF